MYWIYLREKNTKLRNMMCHPLPDSYKECYLKFSSPSLMTKNTTVLNWCRSIFVVWGKKISKDIWVEFVVRRCIKFQNYDNMHHTDVPSTSKLNTNQSSKIKRERDLQAVFFYLKVVTFIITSLSFLRHFYLSFFTFNWAI